MVDNVSVMRSKSNLELEKTELVIGYIPLTDCAPLVTAVKLGLDQKHGLKIRLQSGSSWASIRDRLIIGELDAAHILYGMVYGIHLGIGGIQQKMSVLMTLNQNGQGITLSKQLLGLGIHDGASLAEYIHAHPRELRFAQTFPTGTHAMWLYTWLASLGVDPLNEVELVVLPPPEMGNHMLSGQIHGFCAGEPWNARAIRDGVGFSVVASQDIWPNHPEKVLGTTKEFVSKFPNTAQALVECILEACRYIDEPAHCEEVVRWMVEDGYVNATMADILPRFLGVYENGLGGCTVTKHPIRFHDEGSVNFPYLSDGAWFVDQFKRWGMFSKNKDALAVAAEVSEIALYKRAAQSMEVALPDSEMRSVNVVNGS